MIGRKLRLPDDTVDTLIGLVVFFGAFSALHRLFGEAGVFALASILFVGMGRRINRLSRKGLP